MNDKSQTLDGLWTLAWERLERAAHDRSAPTRHVTLATRDQAGWADARTLVLRAAMAGSARITLHTDALSPKIVDLQNDPRCTLLAWDPEAQLQIRLRAHASIRQADPADWAALPEPARALYGGMPVPGAPLPAPQAHQIAPDQARFTLIDLQAQEVDLLHLGKTRHHRARYCRAQKWAGEWIAP